MMDIPFRIANPLIPVAILLLIACMALLFTKTKRYFPKFPSAKPLQRLDSSLRLRIRAPILYTLSILCVLSGLIAVGRPQKLSSSAEDVNARNLVIAVDLSKSMLTRDFAQGIGMESRIQGVKTVASEFVRGRPFDRVALLIFGSDVFLKVPLTLDHKLVLDALSAISVGDAGERTSLGDALAHALKRIKDVPAKASAVILVTDGVVVEAGVSQVVVPCTLVCHD